MGLDNHASGWAPAYITGRSRRVTVLPDPVTWRVGLGWNPASNSEGGEGFFRRGGSEEGRGWPVLKRNGAPRLQMRGLGTISTTRRNGRGPDGSL